MLESDAHKYWCPEARIVITPYGAAVENRDLGGTNCLGKLCAVWVVIDRESETGHCGLIKGRQ